MLIPFKLIRHRIRKMQSFVNYIFLEVICKAPKLKEHYPDFTLDIVKVDFYKDFLKNHGNLLDTLSAIYQIVQGLPGQDIKTLRRAVLVNNQIRELCIGIHQPVTYYELSRINKGLSDCIRKFCSNLYQNATLKSTSQKKYPTLKDYYKNIVGCDTTCHCCGLDRISNRYNSIRSPFDHFLPQSLYPFTTLNTHNLVPTCEHCNRYKHDKDTLFIQKPGRAGKERIKAFYPFRHDIPEIRIKIKVQGNCDLEKIQPQDIDMQIDCNDHPQELSNWKRLYDIDTRYKAECCSPNMKNNLEQYRMIKQGGMPHNEIINIYKANQYANMNFLKIPFMECMHEKEQHAREQGLLS